MLDDEPLADRTQRQAWQNERAALGLVPGAPEFGRRGVMRRLDGQSVQVVLLPPDPSISAVGFDPDLAAVLPDRFAGQITDVVNGLGHQTVRSSHLLRTAHSNGDNGSRAVLALARHGGVTVGLSERTGRYPLQAGSVVAQRLWGIAGAVRLALHAQELVLAHLAERGRWAPAGPWQISVALPGARGSVLGALASGWEEPDHAFEPNVCVEDDPFVALELADSPRGRDDRRQVLSRVLARVVNAFGTTTPLYLAPGAAPDDPVPDHY